MPYPERQPAPVALADRWLAGAAFALQRVFRRRLPGAEALAQEAARHAQELRQANLAKALPSLRYRIRHAGFTPQVAAEAFGFYCAALAQAGEPAPAPEALGGARWLLAGGMAELADAHQRMHAVALAGFACALHGGGAHLLTPEDAAANALAEAMRPALSGMGLEVGSVASGTDPAARRKAYACAITCAPVREAALDYLRDRAAAGGRPGALHGRLERLATGRGGDVPLTLNGLHAALVLDADVVMLDEARTPIVIARDVDRAQERLLYEQAMELARALRPDEDFHIPAGGAVLSESAAELLGRLATPLGGAWAVAERREELVRLALEVLHGLERDVDYRVDQGRVLRAPRPPEDTEAQAARDAMLQMLLEVKEGCPTSARREVVGRLSVPAFLGRYLHLAGACADARGLEGEFWTLYGLKTALAGMRAPAPPIAVRVFARTGQKNAAALQELRAGLGTAPVLAVRTPAGAKTAEGLISDAGAVDAAIARYGFPGAPAPRTHVEVLVLELHDSERHLVQLCTLYGAGRCKLLLALDEEAVATALGARLAHWLARSAGAAGELPPRLAWIAGRLALRGAERAQVALRQEIASRDQYLRDLLAFSGEGE